MTNTFIKNDPTKALQYFEDKMAFTTGPIELNRAINEKQDIVVVDVRAAEDFVQGHIGGAVSLPRDKWSNPRACAKISSTSSTVTHMFAIWALRRVWSLPGRVIP